MRMHPQSVQLPFVLRLLIWMKLWMLPVQVSWYVLITGRVSPIGNSLPLVGTGPNRDIVVGHLSLDNSDNVCLFVPCGMSSCSFSYVIQRIYCYLSLEKVFALRACRACVSDHVSLSVRGAPLTPDPHCSKAAPRLGSTPQMHLWSTLLFMFINVCLKRSNYPWFAG